MGYRIVVFVNFIRWEGPLKPDYAERCPPEGSQMNERMNHGS